MAITTTAITPVTRAQLDHTPVYDLTHARHDRATCLAPGLFRSLKKGERDKNLDIKYSYGDETIHFLGPRPLNMTDLRTLQGLVAAAGPLGVDIEETDIGARLRELLDINGRAKNSVSIKQSFSGFLKELGLTDGGDNIKALKESFRRLSTVTIISKRGAVEVSSKILSYALDDISEQFHAALNPRLTAAIVGQQPNHVHIDLSETRALNGKSDAARAIHQRLCAWINPGKPGQIEIDKLCEYVWPTPATESAFRQRKKRIRNALADLKNIGWEVTQYARGKYRITRPQIKHKS